MKAFWLAWRQCMQQDDLAPIWERLVETGKILPGLPVIPGWPGQHYFADVYGWSMFLWMSVVFHGILLWCLSINCLSCPPSSFVLCAISCDPIRLVTVCSMYCCGG